MTDDTFRRQPDQEEPAPEQPMLASEPDQAVAPEPERGGRGGMRVLRALLLPVLAVFSAFVVGAIIIIFSDAQTLSLLGTDLGAAVGRAWSIVMQSYGALLSGSIGDPVRLLSALFAGDWVEVKRAFGPLSETIVSATPLIFTGLSVALAFRVGLFNIGAEGQMYIGALIAIIAGFSFVGLPWFIHAPLAVLAGFIGGALWGFIPGLLKARTGAHEVIVTIMLNFVAYRTVDYALKTAFVQRPGRSDPISKVAEPGSWLMPIVEGLRAHWGIAIAVLAAVAVWWLLFRSRWGFEFRAVGLNPRAARYAGMSPGWSTVMSMVIAGGLAGLAGASLMLGGSSKSLSPGFSPGYGFDGITVALVGATRPAGVVAAAFLFGALRAGATPMEAATGTPRDLVVVIQALVILFIAAPALVRAIYRIRTQRTLGTEVFAKGWGS
ncbi:MAG TPA: ABC transporter permease [Candidatus Limnocylindria bacterium]|nr:ABC transporter permease [Candidatus Limnocylindria bacterium]HEX2884379.1 ABC transporter permease [Candidatus Limnocylindria bacterium]